MGFALNCCFFGKVFSKAYAIFSIFIDIGKFKYNTSLPC